MPQVGDSERASLLCKAIVCLLVMAGLLLPLVIFTWDMAFRDSGLPRVKNATIDLADFNNRDAVVPLDGVWEFYWDTWLVTDDVQDVQSDAELELPHSWENMVIDGEKLPAGGIASYRLTVTNCPSNLGYLVRVPDSQTAYRVFIDGKLALTGGNLSRNVDEVEVRSEVISKAIGEIQPTTSEVVIEVASSHTGGLYIAPQLEEVRNATLHPNIIAYLQSGVVVGLFVYIVVFSIIVAFRGSSFRADYLIVLCIILLVTVLTHTELMRLKVVKIIGAHFEYVWILQVLMFCMLPACLYLCSRRLFEYRASRLGIRILVGATAIMTIAALVFSLSPRPWYSGAFAVICVALSLGVIAPILVRAWQDNNDDALLFSGTSVILLSSLIVDALYSAGFFVVNVSYLLGTCAIIYATIMFAIFVKRMVAQERQAFELEHVRYQLKEAEVSLMLSQIRPHFLYNTLTAVMALIPANPQLAQQTLMKFSQYLRTNIDAITNVRMIPFVQELDHIKTYLDIEKLRFDDRLHAIYDVHEIEFLVPQLSIQPLVENAVKHGVCKKLERGFIVLRTWSQDESIYVQVIDNGAGFDTSILYSKDSNSAGIRNVIYRLEEECNATVRFKSAPGKGCTVTVELPKEKAHE